VGTIQDLDYSYDPVGNITQVADNLDNQYSGDYQYDLINRLSLAIMVSRIL